MCGIIAYLGNRYTLNDVLMYSNKIKHRGPDSSDHIKINDNLIFVFHRLAINGLSSKSNQPFSYNGIYLICNGEIFNFKDLIRENGFDNDYQTESDCEIIIHLYLKYGIKDTCNKIDGEFAFILYDSNTDILHAARDHLGIRSLYWMKNEETDEVYFGSELKGFPNMGERSSLIQQFPTGSFWSSDQSYIINQYFDMNDNTTALFDNPKKIIKNIRELFIKAVEKRLLSDRKMACLLSGGLDSTTVTAIVASKFPEYSLNTYSIGLKGSIDLHYAKIAAEYFKTNHVSIELSEEEFLSNIESTIKQIESYDTTSVRASVGNYLVSLYIKAHSSDTVICKL